MGKMSSIHQLIKLNTWVSSTGEWMVVGGGGGGAMSHVDFLRNGNASCLCHLFVTCQFSGKLMSHVPILLKPISHVPMAHVALSN